MVWNVVGGIGFVGVGGFLVWEGIQKQNWGEVGAGLILIGSGIFLLVEQPIA